jgi:hypothetical protein
MALWRRGKTKAVVKRIEATPAEPAEDPRAQADAEYAELVGELGRAFTELVARTGCYFPGDSALTLDEAKERLRLGRGGRPW